MGHFRKRSMRFAALLLAAAVAMCEWGVILPQAAVAYAAELTDDADKTDDTDKTDDPEADRNVPQTEEPAEADGAGNAEDPEIVDSDRGDTPELPEETSEDPEEDSAEDRTAPDEGQQEEPEMTESEPPLPTEEVQEESSAPRAAGEVNLRFEGANYWILELDQQKVEEIVRPLQAGESYSFTIMPNASFYKVQEVRLKDDDGEAVLTQGEDLYHYTIAPADPVTGYTHNPVISVTMIPVYQLTLEEYNTAGVEEVIVANNDTVTPFDLTAGKPEIQGFSAHDTTVYVKTVEDIGFGWLPWVSLSCLNENGAVRGETLQPVEDTGSMSAQEKEYAQRGYYVFRLGKVYGDSICSMWVAAGKACRYRFSREGLPEGAQIIGYVRNEYGEYIAQEIRDEILLRADFSFYFRIKWDEASSVAYRWCDCFPVVVDNGGGVSSSSFDTTTLDGVEGTVWQHYVKEHTEIRFQLVPHTIALMYHADDIVELSVSSGNAKLSEDRKSLDVYGGESLDLSFKVAEGLEVRGVSSEAGSVGVFHDYNGNYTVSVGNMSEIPLMSSISFDIYDPAGKILLSDPAVQIVVNARFAGKNSMEPVYSGEPIEAKSLSVRLFADVEGRKPRWVTLKPDYDYTVSYQNNTNAGKAVLMISAMPDSQYRGSFPYPFEIRKEKAPAEAEGQLQVEDKDWGKELQADLSEMFVFDGRYDKHVKPTGYRIQTWEPGGTLTAQPVIEGDRFTYAVRGDASSDAAPAKITLAASFTNYEDARAILTVRPVKKDVLVLGGKVTVEDKVYDGTKPLPNVSELQVVSREGAALNEQEAAAVLARIKDALSYHYTGTDGTQYDAKEAPVDIGSYKVQVKVAEENQEFKSDYLDAGTFRIREREVTVTADDVALYRTDSIPAQYGFRVDGLAGGDEICPGVFLTCDIRSTEAVGEYPVNVNTAAVKIRNKDGRDVTANYRITGVAGTLRVREPEPGSCTVTYDLSGKGERIRRSGIAAGSLLARPLDPVADGYVFLGWYLDRTLSEEWNFDTDTVQTDTVLYAGWSKSAAQDGLTLCVQEILPQTYTGKAVKPAVTVYAADGKTRLKPNKDYKVVYKNNTDADGKKFPDGEIPAGGMGAGPDDTEQGFNSRLAYAVVTGKGNYTGTVYVNFHIEQVSIGEGEHPASGIVLKYTDQFEEKTGKTAAVVNKLKYKNLSLKYKTDYTLSVEKENGESGEKEPVNLTDKGQIPLNAGTYSLTIAGTGNYGGSVTHKLYIASKAQLLKNAKVKCKGTISNVSKQQLADGVKAEDLTVSMNGETLVQDTHYTVEYADNHAVGTATVTVRGIGDYVGTRTCTFKIKGTTFSEKALQEITLRDMTYTGAALTQNDVRLKDLNGNDLTYGIDYSIGYRNNIRKGKATMVFKANPASGYSGSFQKQFKIDPLNLQSEEILIEGAEKNASGYVLTESVSYRKEGAVAADKIKVRSGATGALLVEGRDYSVSYQNNKEVANGTARMILKGKGNFTGDRVICFDIIKASLAELYRENKVTITPKETRLTYSYRRYREDPESDWEYELQDPDYEFEPRITVKDGRKTLTRGVDYEVEYFGNVRSELVEGGGTAYAEIRSLGNYAGPDGAEGETITVPLSIYGNKISNGSIYIVYGEETDLTYTGRQITPEITVYYGKPADISKAKQNKITDEDVLTQEKPEPDPDAEEPPEYAYGLTKLQEYQDGAGDYFLSYGANVAKGRNGKVTIRGTGNYAGSVTNTFTIVPREIYTKIKQPDEGGEK